MNAAEFVDAIRTEVRDSSPREVIALLERPPGRQPAANLIALSRWFNTLGDADRGRVREVVAMGSDHAVFGLLAVLDGVRVIEDGPDRGKLELRHVRGAQTTLLNDPSGPMLHDLLPRV